MLSSRYLGSRRLLDLQFPHQLLNVGRRNLTTVNMSTTNQMYRARDHLILSASHTSQSIAQSLCNIQTIESNRRQTALNGTFMKLAILSRRHVGFDD